MSARFHLLNAARLYCIPALCGFAPRLRRSYSPGDSVAQRRDEGVRFTTLIQLKRSIALALYDSSGQGKMGEGAIKQFQALAQALNGVLDCDQGYIELNVAVLNQRLDAVDKVYKDVQALGDMAALWQKYPPASSKTN